MSAMVLLFVCIAAFASGSSAANLPHLDGRIVGGEVVGIEQYPYQLSLQWHGAHMCGASLIHPKMAITAAHCTHGASPPALTIRAGSSYKTMGGSIIGVSAIHEHPQFNPKTVAYDLSIIELTEEMSPTVKIQIIPLINSTTNITEGSSAITSGWGATREGGSLSEQLQAVDVSIISQGNCTAFYQNMITDTMICAGYADGGKDACQGDSGGPLIYNGELIGVVSWGFGCARPLYPGVYTSIQNLRDHIDLVMNLTNVRD